MHSAASYSGSTLLLFQTAISFWCKLTLSFLLKLLGTNIYPVINVKTFQPVIVVVIHTIHTIKQNIASLNKLGRSSLGDATYQISRLWILWFQTWRFFSCFPYKGLCKICDPPELGHFLAPGAYFEQKVEVHKVILHIKYQVVSDKRIFSCFPI